METLTSDKLEIPTGWGHILNREPDSDWNRAEARFSPGPLLRTFAAKYGMPWDDAAYALSITFRPLNSEHHAFEQRLGDEPWLGSDDELTIILTQLHDPTTPVQRHAYLRDRIWAHSAHRANAGRPPSMSKAAIDAHFEHASRR